jgi:hypothetical protein
VIAVIAGSILFISRATDYSGNTVFWIKMVIIAFAGINMIVFEFITIGGVQRWNLAPTPPQPARLAGEYRSPVGCSFAVP